MGVHTGDSITVAPAQTLTDKEYQLMRDAAVRIIRAIGVDTGGSNIQFAVDPRTGRQVVIEMTRYPLGAACVADEAGRLLGLITDGDVRRALQKHEDIRELRAQDVMTQNPITIAPTPSVFGTFRMRGSTWRS